MRPDDDPWDTPRSVMWAIVTVACCAASLLTSSVVPVLALAGAAGVWPAVVKATRR